MNYIGIFGCIVINLKKLSGKNRYSKSKQTKHSGFVELGVRWAERDIIMGPHNYVLKNIKKTGIM